MPIFIEIQDLAANALIELLNHEHKPEVKFDALVEYGQRVIDALRSQGTLAFFQFPLNGPIQIPEKHARYLEISFDSNGEKLVRLKEGATIGDLWPIRVAMPLNCVDAFTSYDTLGVLGMESEFGDI
ncbi:MAG: hypothetical protein FWG10_06185 [Eubacteriaceae bacterium]|nr:hypothetical protein [Eubacteriaceae bacterium]